MANEGIPDQDRTQEGVSRWGDGEAERYAKIGHGVDGGVFLDPYLRRLLNSQQMRRRRVLDIGSGTGPWSKWALECGAEKVVSIDINAAMLEKARIGISDEIKATLNLLRADSQQLPIVSAEDMPEKAFDLLMSINVGCNLGTQAFRAHFQEAYRVAQPGARFVVTAPISLLRVFTTGDEEINVQERIDNAWKVRGEKTAKQVIAELGEDILRATFLMDRDGKPILISEANGKGQLVSPGQPILRKIPGNLCVENNYHVPEEYMVAALESGWDVSSFFDKTFVSEEQRQRANAGLPTRLGKEYIQHAPFLVLELRKPIMK